MTRIDILIATRNSEERLGKTLQSLADMFAGTSVNKKDIRVVLVNNASNDHTKEVASGYLEKLPLEIVDAPVPGKSNALNTAMEAGLKGDIIFFTDDDVVFAPDWLDNFVNAIQAQPDYSIFAGRIVGHWEKKLDPELASWIPMSSTYAVHERENSGPCDPGLVWGPNMAVRREVFKKDLRFNPLIGPQPGILYPMGQDTEFAHRVVEAGFKSFFVGDAVVKHTIKAATANEDWIIRRAERLGYGIFAIKNVENFTERTFPGLIPLAFELWFKMVVWRLFFPLTNLMPRGKHRFWCRWRRYYHAGLWRGYQAFAR